MKIIFIIFLGLFLILPVNAWLENKFNDTSQLFTFENAFDNNATGSGYTFDNSWSTDGSYSLSLPCDGASYVKFGMINFTQTPYITFDYKSILNNETFVFGLSNDCSAGAPTSYFDNLWIEYNNNTVYGQLINFTSQGNKCLWLGVSCFHRGAGYSFTSMNIDNLRILYNYELLNYTGNQNKTKFLAIPDTVDYLLNAYLNLTGFNVTTTYSQCYQETANNTHASDGSCVLNYSGNYSSQGVYISPSTCPQYIYDGSYSSSCQVNGVSPPKDANVTINYIKPINSVSARWRVKDGASESTVNIPNQCYNLFSEYINLIVRTYRDGAGVYYSSWSCLNSTGYQVLKSEAVSGQVYEEAIYWNITNINYPLNVSVSSTLINSGYLNNTIKTSNLVSYINNYLSSCSFINGYCLIPLVFNSINSGIIRYDNLVFTDEGINENNVTYSNPLYEGQNNIIIGNFTLGQTPTSITLNYNGTLYTPSVVTNNHDYILTSTISNILIDSNTNFSFYYIFNFSDDSYNSNTYIQTISNTELTSNCTGNYLVLNITNYDEQTLNLLNGTVEYLFYLQSSNNEISSINGIFTGENIALCSNQNLTESNIRYNLQLRYYADSYVYKTYNIQNNEITNLPVSIDLFYLNNSIGTAFKINYLDFNYLTHPNAIIQIQRQYLSDNTYNTVEIPKIDNTGKTTGSFNTNNIRYKFIVIENGEIIDTFNDIFPSCQNIVLGECSIDLRGSESTTSTTYGDFTYTLVKTNNSVVLTYVIPSGTPRNINFNTVQNSRFLDSISSCNSSVFASGGTITCYYNNTVGDSLIDTTITISDGTILQGQILIAEDLSGFFLLNNYFIAFILMLSLALMFISSAIMLVIGGAVGLIYLGLIFLIRGADLITVASSLGWLIVAVVIIIYKIAQKEERS